MPFKAQLTLLILDLELLVAFLYIIFLKGFRGALYAPPLLWQHSLCIPAFTSKSFLEQRLLSVRDRARATTCLRRMRRNSPKRSAMTARGTSIRASVATTFARKDPSRGVWRAKVDILWGPRDRAINCVRVPELRWVSNQIQHQSRILRLPWQSLWHDPPGDRQRLPRRDTFKNRMITTPSVVARMGATICRSLRKWASETHIQRRMSISLPLLLRH